ncbi:sigma-70 family RNA polymerase sigma factor [Proteiniclasticum sp. C24MP]|uniref:sigma-70 family RNA polymerase sigma factor n=1 Tax=Proteiniclasticum sp. C24MP TaxID=3374101 RepID=UPI003754DCB0
MSDRELMKMIEKNPDKGIDQMMTLYMGMVYNIVKNRISTFSSKEDVEECVIDVFHEIYRQRNAIDLGKGSIKGYIAVIAKRKAIGLYRSRNDKETFSVSFEEKYISPIESSHSGIDDVLIEKEDIAEILSLIKTLREPDSEIFIRKYYFRQSTRSISHELGIRENTIDKKVSRGRNKLRKLLGGNDNG